VPPCIALGAASHIAGDGTLGAQKFGQMFAAGTRLSQQQAVAAVRDRRGT
jgi:hypothetical protein